VITRYDPSSEDIWLFTFTAAASVQSIVDFKTKGTMKTILDCNPFSA
jgi:hypothetical protein